jgi:serine/threonine-protein kinase
VNCPDENLLTAFADRELSPAERAELEAHLDGCSQCFAIVAEMARAQSEPSTSSDGAKTAGDATGDATTQASGKARGPAALGRGALVGRYTVVEILGQGGMGTVYLAHDPELDRRVALKVLRRAASGSSTGRRLTSEARIMARLAHPNIVTVFDAGEAEGRTYLAMELLDGGTLTDWLCAETRSRDAIVDTFLVAGRALAAAHAAGVVHRDFKPANVLLDRRGRVAVADFGIAASFAGEGGGESSAEVGAERPARSVSGTPAYMSPEQRRGDAVGPASDQFSFAVALYEALYDERPFTGAASSERGERGATDMARVAPVLRGPLRRALSPDPADRFPTMSDLVAALERARNPPKKRAAGAVAGAAAALAIVAVGLVATVARKPVSPEPLVAASPPLDAGALDAAKVTRARTLVVALPFDNRTGDPSFDGVVEAILTTLLSSSRHLDTALAASLRTLVPARAADAGKAEDETIARELQAREDRPVILVRGVLSAGAERDATTLALTATDAASGRVVAELTQTTPSPSALALTTLALASRLRGALGDVEAPDEGPPPRLSTSLAALHDWARGQAAMTAGHSEAATPILEDAVREDPGFALAHASLGRAYYNTQNEPAAKREIDLALRSPDGFTQRGRLFVLADSYAAEGRSSEAITVDEQLLQLWPADAPTEISMVATAIHAREWPLALALARRAIADHPGSSSSRTNLLIALIASGQLAEASTEGAALLHSEGRPPVYAYVLVALASALQGDRDRALAAYDQLATVDEELADEGRADLALFEGRLDDAERLLQPHIAAAVAGGDPSDARTEYRSLAICRSRRGDRAGAVAAARAGLGDLADADAPAGGGGAVELQYSLASTLVSSGSEKEAVRLVRAWNDHPSATWRAYAKVLAGDLALHRGHPAEALESYQAARRLRDEWRMRERLAEAYLAQRDWDRGAAELAACWERRGEAALIETPSLQYLTPVARALAEARAHRVDAGAPGAAAP